MSDPTDKIVTEGRFAALEDDDNSIDVSNPAYIGTDPEYRNAAEYDGVALDAPLDSDDPDPVADKAKASAEELSNLDVNRAGHTKDDGKLAARNAGDDTASTSEPVEEPAADADSTTTSASGYSTGQTF